jgi:hypothetical protein
MEGCNFHFISHFEKCSFDVSMNCEFFFGELHGIFPILIVVSLNTQE